MNKVCQQYWPPLESAPPLYEDKNGNTMLTLDTLRLEKKSEIIRLAELRGCRNVRVFGSVVHGENRPDSDVDFLVDLESGRTIFDLAGFLGDLRELLGTEIDVVESRSIHPYIRDRVLAEAVGL
jgi:predicted nucleotidyltransferase